MRHNPLCFTGHGRGSTLTINCLASFFVLWRASSAFPRSWRAKRVLESITNVTARYAWANLIQASSVFRSSAGARLCRITSPRNSSGRCHGASIRRNPGFGIASPIVRRQLRHSNALRGFLHDVPNCLHRHPIAPYPAYLVDPAEHSSSINSGRREPILEFGSYPIGNRNRSDVASLTNQIHNCPMLFALLEMIQGQSYALMPPQSARE
jgi:hypothetical protein